MCEIEGQYKLDCESAHNRRWNHILGKPGAKAAECFSHELKYKAYVSAIRSLMLKFTNQMADIVVADKVAIPISKIGQNFFFENVMLTAIGFSTQYFQCPEFVLRITNTVEKVSGEMKILCGEQGSTHLACKSLTSHTVE